MYNFVNSGFASKGDMNGHKSVSVTRVKTTLHFNLAEAKNYLIEVFLEYFSDSYPDQVKFKFINIQMS